MGGIATVVFMVAGFAVIIAAVAFTVMSAVNARYTRQITRYEVQEQAYQRVLDTLDAEAAFMGHERPKVLRGGRDGDA